LKRTVSIAAIITIIVLVVAAAVLLQSNLNQTSPLPVTPHELDFTVSGKNSCLRFLNDSVSVVYIPIATGVNENWKLTINATNMAGGAGGWVDLYTYKGYWDGGVNNTCLSRDVYPILADVVDAQEQLKASEPYTQTFGGPEAETQTLFFIFPPGGQSTFQVTLKQVQ
jgi:hypothetical protein